MSFELSPKGVLTTLQRKLEEKTKRIEGLKKAKKQATSAIDVKLIAKSIGGELTERDAIRERIQLIKDQIETKQQQTDQNGNQLNVGILSIPVILGAGVVIFLLVRRKK